MTHKSDVDLVALAREGDKAAFGDLIERHQPTLKRLVQNMVHDAYLAQELTQEALLQAYLALPQLQQPQRFRSWLYSIGLNLCRNHLRTRRVDVYSLEAMMGGLHVDAMPLVGLWSNNLPDPQEVAEERDLHQRVLTAVKTLSPKNQKATLLFYYEQLTLSEIAAILGVSVVAVKGRLHKSRQQLRIKLESQSRPINSISSISKSNAVHQAYMATGLDLGTRKKKGENSMIPVKVIDVLRKKSEEEEEGKTHSHYIIVLLDEVGKRILNIWIGHQEGQEIARHLLSHDTNRPLTYNFTASLLAAAGATLTEVRIESLKEEVFYATVKLDCQGEVREIDARPSDAINLALRLDCPLYVQDTIMQTTGVDISSADKLPSGLGLKAMSEELDEMKQKEEARRQKHQEASAAEKAAQQEKTQQELMTLLFGEEG